MSEQVTKLITAEGWEIVDEGGVPKVLALGECINYAHPFSVYAKIYRINSEPDNPELKYQCLRGMHRYAWPEYEKTWNYWDERRLRAYCDGYTYISYAGGASTGKSDFAARLALLFWMAAPNKRTVLVASTTLQALSTRIWGYISRFANELQIKFPLSAYAGNAPKILYNRKDPIHGMYALAAGKSTDEKAISNWIGRHPKEAMLMILDEATDLNPVLLNCLPNLESGGVAFTCIVIGNSCSRFDLHGCLSTPVGGWKNVNFLTTSSWPTTQKNGICLYFNPYDSPAIHEKDLAKRKLLAKFLITAESIAQKKIDYGDKSDGYWRFVLGLWKDDSGGDTVISQKFIDQSHATSKAEWSGLYPLHVVAGLDPSFSTGGDSCILRLAVLGQSINGKIMLDYRKEELLFRIKISSQDERSIELQIADRVLEILNEFKIPLSNLALDANGQGRALAEVIRLRAKSMDMPLKIYSIRQGVTMKNAFDVILKTNFELWDDMRKFVQTDQIRGLDFITINQLTSRLVTIKNFKQILEPKPMYKIRMGSISPTLAHSPDEADAASLALQVARIKFGFTPGQTRDIKKVNTFTLEKMYAFKQDMKEDRGGLPQIQANYKSDLYSLSKVKSPFQW